MVKLEGPGDDFSRGLKSNRRLHNNVLEWKANLELAFS